MPADLAAGPRVGAAEERLSQEELAMTHAIDHMSTGAPYAVL